MQENDITRIITDNFDKLAVDYPFYSSLNQKIKNKQGKLVAFYQNRMQLRLWQLYQEDVAKGVPVRWLIVKARQLGCTKWITGLFYWLTTLNFYKSSLVVSYDAPSAQNMCQTYQTMYLNSHPKLQPRVRRMNRDLIHFATDLKTFQELQDAGLDSQIMVASADSVALGRSYTFQYVHLSEYAIWPEYGIDIADRLEALGAAVPDLAETIVIKETTAKGQNEVYEEWQDTFSNQRKIFISWLADDEYRKELNYLTSFDLSLDSESRYGDEREERKNIIEELKFWYPLESKKLQWLEHESMCRLNWRRYMIDNKYKGNKWKFKSEFPTTPSDAFNLSSKSVFSIPRIIEMENKLDDNKIKPNLFSYDHNDVIKDFNYKFFPASQGNLRVFVPPQEGSHYVIGADGAQGVTDGDDSSAVVLKLPNLEEVASFNDILSPTNFAGLLNYLSLLYNRALLGVERNDKGGFAAIEQLLNNYNYSNLFYHIDPITPKFSTNIQYGWITNAVSRQIMIRDMMDLIENKQIYIRSKEILDQCKSFVKHPKTGKIAAAPGKHDDLVIAIMIAVQLAKQIHIPREASYIRPPKGSLLWHERQLKLSRMRTR